MYTNNEIAVKVVQRAILLIRAEMKAPRGRDVEAGHQRTEKQSYPKNGKNISGRSITHAEP